MTKIKDCQTRAILRAQFVVWEQQTCALQGLCNEKEDLTLKGAFLAIVQFFSQSDKTIVCSRKSLNA